MLQKLRERYEKYEQDVQKTAQEASFFDGVFGMGTDTRKAPCHMEFYEDVQRWVKDFLKTEPDSDTAYQAVRWILMAPAGRQGDAVYWFLYAAQGLCRELIPLLMPGDCAQLRELYDASFPRRDRMPVQKEIYICLRLQADKS